MNNQIAAPISNPLSQPSSQAAPYPPSFIDRFMGWIQRLPLPYWLTYFVLFLLESLLLHMIAWVSSWLQPPALNAMIFIFPFWQWGTFAIMTYLNSVATRTLSSFSPLLDLGAQELEKLKAEFTSMPLRPVLLSSLFWAIVYVSITAIAYQGVYIQMHFGAVFGAITILVGFISYTTGGAIYYHSIRQLILVYRTTRLVKHYNLFRLGPVYAFSRLTSLIGISWTLLLSVTLLLFPQNVTNVGVLAIFILQGVLAVAAFVLPLWFIHRRLVAEKLQLLAECDQHVELAAARLHKIIEAGDLNDMQPLNHALTGLNTERQVLNNIPTWPWLRGTLTGFVSAVVLPVIIFIIQLAVGKWLGR
jgi:hypothetical protein